MYYKNHPTSYKANNFIKKFLDNKSLFISTKTLGYNVFNIKTKNFKQDIGYLGYYLDTTKITSLSNYLNTIAIKNKLKNYILILSNIKEGVNYYFIEYKRVLLNKEPIKATNREELRYIAINILVREGFNFNKEFIIKEIVNKENSFLDKLR